MLSSAAWEIAWGLVTVLVFYVFAASSRRSVAIGAVLLMIPFQTIVTRYATSSVLVAYALAALLLLNGGLKVRMLPWLGLIVLAYLVSLSQADDELMLLHVIYLFQFFSCLVVFLLAYNFSRVIETERSVIDLLLAMNVMTIFYCLLQVLAGADQTFVPFGIEALAFNKNRIGDDARLIGPFGNPGSTADFFTIMILVCAVELMFARGWRKTLGQMLILLNLVGLIATGNRTGLLVLVVIFPVMLYAYRQQLGVARAWQYLAVGTLLFLLATSVAINYTGFARMFDRMAKVTETQNGIPETRAKTWPLAIAKIKQHPWVGSGPFFVDPATARILGWLPSQTIPYPHSLYLYLLGTIGVLGLVAFLAFFLVAWRLLYATLRRVQMPAYPASIVRLGLLLIPAFLVAQITLEFNRLETIDYAQFVFALIGMLVGIGDRYRSPAVRARA